MGRNVKGALFIDYVRMIKGSKDADWSKYLPPDDMAFLKQKIIDNKWYPFDTFERMGVGILEEIAGGNMEAVRMWGRLSTDNLLNIHGALVVEGDPLESLMRFQVLRGGYFDFDPINLKFVSDNFAKFEIRYDMCEAAEEAATYQTLGIFERLLELSGVGNVKHQIKSKAWKGDPVTVLEFEWSAAPPARKVKGVLFLDYVRMIKGRKDADWSKYLNADDLAFLKQKIIDTEWYPLDTFERMGVGILEEIAGGNMEAVRSWGYHSIDDLLKSYRSLVCEGNPGESLMRFQVLRRSFFDFTAIYIQTLLEKFAKLEMDYGMCKAAEEAASYQALGFFHRLIELSGAKEVQYRFTSKTWEEADSTIIELRWS